MDVASLGSGTLPPGTDRSHKIRRRISSPRQRPRLEYHSEADDTFEGMEGGRVSAYDSNISKQSIAAIHTLTSLQTA
jgi:hypothetical protein